MSTSSPIIKLGGPAPVSRTLLQRLTVSTFGVRVGAANILLGAWRKGCCCSVTQSCLTLCDPWTAAHQASLSFTISQSWLKLVSMPSDHLILCCPLLFLLSIFPRIRVFSSESALYVRWPGYWTAGEFPSILKLITEGTVYV